MEPTSEYLNHVFKINENAKIEFDYIEKDVEESKFYVIEDFFENPDEITEFLTVTPPIIWKEDEEPSYNTIYFDDMVHEIEAPNVIKPVYDLLSNICNEGTETYDIRSNLFKFKNHSFNNFHENYWFPHKDHGHTGIVYLNKDDDYNGTNIYRCIDPTYSRSEVEHYEPWISKEKFELTMTVPPKYNRLFLFNAFKYYHGMNISNDRYMGENEYRMNLVFFLDYV
jgi:hypothetical protein